MKVGIIVFPGSNCDHDMYHAFKKILNVDTEFIWHKESNLSSFDIIVLPGGFSYGDYLRAGAIARFSPVMKSVIEQAKMGTCIFGVCNGFQILTESGLLPGSLSSNLNRKFICKDVYIKNENNNTIFSNKIKKDRVLTIPIAHAEGNYYCDEDTYRELLDNNQVVFRYSEQNGEVSTESNPNGSLYNIAGIMNKKGNVLGMMPHPERNVEKILSNADGIEILSSVVDAV